MSKIEWTGKTWNPVTGCDKVSPGCKNCYAEVMANRLQKMGQPNYADGFKLTLQPQMLDVPLKIKKPTTFFVNSMSDLFHKDIPDEYIDKVFATMALCPQHTFQVLTKRADRMREYMKTRAYKAYNNFRIETEQFPPHNIWLGVSVENQKAADERIPQLLDTPAAVRFLSCEPLLEEIQLYYFDEDFQALRGVAVVVSGGVTVSTPDSAPEGYDDSYIGIDWVIVGGESGHRARVCQVEWIRRIVQQCQAAFVPVFVKQLGATVYANNDNGFEGELETSFPMDTETEDWFEDPSRKYQGAPIRVYLKNRKGGDISEFPADLKIREFPRGEN